MDLLVNLFIYLLISIFGPEEKKTDNTEQFIFFEEFIDHDVFD